MSSFFIDNAISLLLYGFMKVFIFENFEDFSIKNEVLSGESPNFCDRNGHFQQNMLFSRQKFSFL